MPSSQARTDREAAPRRDRGALRRTGEWCARHFVTVLVLWVAALAGLQVLQHAYGGDYSDDFSLPGTQSQEGLDVLKAHAPQAGGYSAQVVLHDADKPLTSVSDQVATAVADLGKLPDVLSAQNPLPSSGSAPPPPPDPNTGPLSSDQKTAYITVRFSVQPATLDPSYLDGVDAAVQPLRSAGVEVEYGGPLG
ncbi:transporter, partial [Streptomyces sp. ZEA17I]|uniref:MMPL family transporter n=1 Tax=Streptomyces sp. ZEA17I TaxID=2202516 RepID=UPI000D9A9D5C